MVKPLKQAIQSRIESDRHLPAGYAVLDNLPYPVFLVDKQGVLTWVNHLTEQFFQTSHQLLVGARLDSLIQSDSALFSMIRRAGQAGQAGHSQVSQSISDTDIVLHSPRIGRHYVDIQVSSLPSHAHLFVVSFQQRALAGQLREQTAFEGAALSMSKMNALLAHEVKNPLAGIKGAAQLIETELGDESRELCVMIATEVDRIAHLLSRIESMAGDAPLQFSEVNIHEVLDHCLSVLRGDTSKKVVFKKAYDPSLPLILADKGLLIQCFLNLIKNAHEAVSDAGEITLKTSYSISHLRARKGQLAGQSLPLQIDIIDNGQGIDENLASHIFEPFISNKPEGSGLGLALVASVVSDHGGSVQWVPTASGTCMRVNLPLPQPLESDELLTKARS
ncbi:MAG: two-component system sensor histidine kinase NtrB [Candidatus Puniceispirillaceae bacterium]